MTTLESCRRKELEDLADFIATENGIGVPVNVVKIAEDNGISYCLNDYQDYFDGMLECEDGYFHIYINNRGRFSINTPRIRFSFAHELGHLLDSTPSINNMPSEERELNADKKVIELGLQEYLISALNKMCPNDELTKKRINALKGICMYNMERYYMPVNQYIIESFDNNPKSILLKYGEDLKKAICRYLATKKNYNLKCNYIFLHNKNEWESLWHTLESACEQGEIPIIHFISHGESDGLKISSDTIPWKDVGEQFSKINKLSHNLFVTMHVCYSACLLEHISEYTFIGCICAYEKVYRSSNVLKPRFISFYESIFNNQSLCKAIDAFKNEILQEEVNMNKNHWIVCLKNIFEDNYEKLPLEYWKVNTK